MKEQGHKKNTLKRNENWTWQEIHDSLNAFANLNAGDKLPFQRKMILRNIFLSQ